MDLPNRRWWALPAALATLVVAACGAAASTAGGPDRDPAAPGAVTPTTPSRAPASVPLGECPPGGTGRGWAISLPSTDIHGADTPEDAANSTRYGLPPEYAFASTTWTTMSSLPPMVFLAQEQGSLEVSQLPNGTWYVTAGSYCD